MGVSIYYRVNTEEVCRVMEAMLVTGSFLEAMSDANDTSNRMMSWAVLDIQVACMQGKTVQKPSSLFFGLEDS